MNAFLTVGQLRSLLAHGQRGPGRAGFPPAQPQRLPDDMHVVLDVSEIQGRSRNELATTLFDLSSETRTDPDEEQTKQPVLVLKALA
jgi:hypothetical protein